MPEISVIVPVYNVEPYLHRCVDSILAQTFTGFELILVDDGSPDNCGQICDEYAEKDSRVRVIHQENGGLSAARNAGINWAFANSDSEWLSFIDSDDWVHPQYLELMLSAAIQNSASICVCEIEKCAEQDITRYRTCRGSSYALPSEELYLRYTQSIFNVSVCGKLFSKDCFLETRFPVGKLWEDLATTYKLILSVPICAVVAEALYFYYINQNGIVRRQWTSKRLDEFDAYEEQLDFFSKEAKWKDIYATLQGTYIRAISYSYFMEQESNLSPEEKRYYANILQKKMRLALKKYKKSAGISFMENRGVFETAYPRLMQVYWIIRSRLDRRKTG